MVGTRSIMPPARFLVCEKTGRWAVALRRESAGRQVRVYETRSLADCRRELESSPASFVAAELTVAGAEKLIAWIDGVSRELPQVRVAVLADREAASWDWPSREAGAIGFTCSPRRLAPILRMARRHLAAAPEAELTFREQVEQRMPWQRYRQAGKSDT